MKTLIGLRFKVKQNSAFGFDTSIGAQIHLDVGLVSAIPRYTSSKKKLQLKSFFLSRVFSQLEAYRLFVRHTNLPLSISSLAGSPDKNGVPIMSMWFCRKPVKVSF